MGEFQSSGIYVSNVDFSQYSFTSPCTFTSTNIPTNYIPQYFTTTGTNLIFDSKGYNINTKYFLYSQEGTIEKVLTEEEYNKLIEENKIKKINELPKIELINL